jgi:hypothetical protein
VVADHHHTCWAYISEQTGSVGTAASDQRQAGIIKLQPLLPTGQRLALLVHLDHYLF